MKEKPGSSRQKVFVELRVTSLFFQPVVLSSLTVVASKLKRSFAEKEEKEAIQTRRKGGASQDTYLLSVAFPSHAVSQLRPVLSELDSSESKASYSPDLRKRMAQEMVPPVLLCQGQRGMEGGM